jgi:hypothetical protein
MTTTATSPTGINARHLHRIDVANVGMCAKSDGVQQEERALLSARRKLGKLWRHLSRNLTRKVPFMNGRGVFDGCGR